MLISKEIREIAGTEEARKFSAMLQKIDKKEPTEEDLEEAKKMLMDNPHLLQLSQGWSGSRLQQFLDKLGTNKNTQLLLEAEIMSIKDNLGYSSANQMEKLIIEQILSCWARINYVEDLMSAILTQNGLPFKTLEYWQNTLTHCQNRYLKAIETLARIKKINKAIALQVNIATEGGKQINVNNG